jgi:signal transduction histidine kinase
METRDRQVGGKAPESGGDVRGDHLGFVAHEVRNPLSTALWSAELLARMAPEERGGPRGEKLTAMCLRSLGRVRQLIEDHFLCERLDARGIPVRAEAVLLRPLLEELVGRRSLELASPELDVQAELSVLADRVLLDRAIDAMLASAGREGAAVRISAREDGGRVTIRIAGMAPGPNALDDPKKGAHGDPKGRALALPMARRIADALDGSLAMDGDALVLSVQAAANHESSTASTPGAHEAGPSPR